MFCNILAKLSLQIQYITNGYQLKNAQRKYDYIFWCYEQFHMFWAYEGKEMA